MNVFLKEDFFSRGGVGEGVRLGGGPRTDVEDGVRGGGGRGSVAGGLAEGVQILGVKDSVDCLGETFWTIGTGTTIFDWIWGSGFDSDSEVCEGDVDSDRYGVSGKERVDVDLESMSALGRLSFTGSVGLPDFTSPATPLVTTCGCTPRKGTSSPRTPMTLC